MPVTAPIASRMVIEYCRKRVATVLPPRDVETLCSYLLSLLDQQSRQRVEDGNDLARCMRQDGWLKGAAHTYRGTNRTPTKGRRSLWPKSAHDRAASRLDSFISLHL